MDINEQNLNVPIEPRHKHVYNCSVANGAVQWECECGMKLTMTLVDYEFIGEKNED